MTGSANKSATGATLSASYSGITTGHAAQNVGFKYWKDGSTDVKTAYVNDTFVGSGTYSVDIANLSMNTVYRYQAVMDIVDPDTGNYVTIEGEVKSFTTDSAGTITDMRYLICYEVPALSLSGTGTSGYYTGLNGKNDTWYSYGTTNSMRAVATHTFKDSGDNNRQKRNYTVMLDGDKKAPVWTAHAMHASMWPRRENVGRNEKWECDPAFDDTWQQSGVSGYSKGHLVASNYMQSTVEQNKQTFYYSNQAPQYQTSFNDGVWNQLENAVVNHIPTGRDTLYVVTGVLYEYEGTPNTVSGVPIPSHFYKCLMLCSFDESGDMTAAKGCAYVFTNEAHSGMAYSEGITTIDSIESRAGFDFFPRVKSTLQTAAEAMKKAVWSTN